VPQITRLDGTSTPEIMSSQPDMAAAQQFAAERLRIYDATSDGTISVPQQQQQQQGWYRSLGMDAAYATSTNSKLRFPLEDQRQHQVSGPSHQLSLQQQQQFQKQPANWSFQAGYPGLAHSSRAVGEGGMSDSGRTADQFRSSHKVYIVDAAVQTVDMSSGPIKQLRAESSMLKQQLIQLTGVCCRVAVPHSLWN